MEKKIKLDPSKIIFDGRGFQSVITDKDRQKLIKVKEQVLKELLSEYFNCICN